MNRHSERSEESIVFCRLQILHFVQDDNLPGLIENLLIRLLKTRTYLNLRWAISIAIGRIWFL